MNHIAVRASRCRHSIDRYEPVVGLDAGEFGGTAWRDCSNPKLITRGVKGHPNSAEPIAGGALIARDLGRRIAREPVESRSDAVEQGLVDLVLGKRSDARR